VRGEEHEKMKKDKNEAKNEVKNEEKCEMKKERLENTTHRKTNGLG
jgi:hypothetical protein